MCLDRIRGELTARLLALLPSLFSRLSCQIRGSGTWTARNCSNGQRPDRTRHGTRFTTCSGATCRNTCKVCLGVTVA